MRISQQQMLTHLELRELKESMEDTRRKLGHQLKLTVLGECRDRDKSLDLDDSLERSIPRRPTPAGGSIKASIVHETAGQGSPHRQ